MATKRTNTRKRRKGTTSEAPSKRRKARPKRRRAFWTAMIVGALAAVALVGVLVYAFFISPLSFRWRAMIGQTDYPSGYEVQGIDISHYQGDIDWERLRNAQVNGAPLTFVIAKATEGATLRDENFSDNFYRARRNDLVRGAYHFFTPATDAALQARFFLKEAHLESGDLRPALDVEQRGKQPLSTFRAEVKRWLDIVEQEYGSPPIIYSYVDFKRRYLSGPEFDRYPLWIANFYRPKLNYSEPWALWQYTDRGRVDGISHKVDLDLFNGTRQEFAELLLSE